MHGPKWCRRGASRRLGRLSFVAALVIGLVAQLGAAAAQDKKKKVIRLEEIMVEGRIQKPQAIYILQRSILNFGELDRVESFLPKVSKSIEQDPF
jgi:hypothetical protein